jgi:beta-galactosidase
MPRFFHIHSKAWLATVLLGGSLISLAHANDNIFPPAPAAANAINFDNKGFLINGQREFVASGSIHYARVPRELWHERLLQLKRSGFNTVQTYVMWNFQEPTKGQIDMTTGARDLGEFLKEAQDVGLYAVVRVGPYVCAEWDSGGYPVWLRFVPDLKPRGDNAPFLQEMDAFWDKLLPIVAAHQINHGGNVIMVQLENEHPEGWGTDMPNPYFTHMQKKAVDLGIEVPYFFSGLHHATDSAGGSHWGDDDRKNPWYSTETWIRWYDKYGNSDPNALMDYTRNIWNIIANGGNGFNLYMFHGGTNFDYYNDNEDASSYDYGTLIGQAGDLRNLYYTIKRAGTFATSFPNILDNGNDSTDKYAKFSTSRTATAGNPPKDTPAINPYARTGEGGTIVFLRNTQRTPETATLESGQVFNLDPREVAPILVDTTLAPGVRAKLGAARTLGLANHGATTTWIVHGKPDEKGHIELDLDQDGAIAPGATAFQVQSTDAKHPVIDFTFAKDPQQLILTSGKQTLRIIAESTDSADHTWIVGDRGAQSVVIGPDYVGEFSETNGKATLNVARTFGHPALTSLTIYGEAPQPRAIAVTDPAPNDDTTAPALGAWQVARFDAPSAADFDDSSWYASDQPAQLGIDGDISAYGWYRASFDAPSAGQATLNADIANDAVVFLNGKLVGFTYDKRGINLDLTQGKNSLAIFVGFIGRGKAFNYVHQPLLTYDPKGIKGNVTVTISGQQIPVTGWKLHGGIPAPDASTLTWEPAPTADLGVPAFFRTEFTAKAIGATGPCPIYRVTTKGLSRGNIWLNGHNLGRYPEMLKIDGLYLPECWLKDGTNSLVIFDEAGHVPTGVHLWVEREASREVFQVQEP